MIDKVIYINLDKRDDRRRHMESLLKEHNLNQKAMRLSGVDGRKLNINKISSDLVTNSGKYDAVHGTKVYVPLTMGGIGCALSHRKAYEMIINNKMDRALILEDDVYFDKKFGEKLKTLMGNLPTTDFDILFIGYHSAKNVVRVKNNNYFVIPQKVYGLFGYIVTQRGAQKLMNVFPITWQIDTEISFHFNKMKVYATSPKHKIVFSDQSSIHTKFGTDIQIRKQAVNNDTASGTPYYTEFFLFAVLVFLVVFMILIYMLA